MTEATPRPWFYSPQHIEEGPAAVRAGESFINNWIVCTTASDADAALIVTAVNNYDEALALLGEAAISAGDLADMLVDGTAAQSEAALRSARINAFLEKKKGNG